MSTSYDRQGAPRIFSIPDSDEIVYQMVLSIPLCVVKDALMGQKSDP
jgi:hypothetical protein